LTFHQAIKVRATADTSAAARRAAVSDRGAGFAIPVGAAKPAGTV
jgi:hypothetical protein